MGWIQKLHDTYQTCDGAPQFAQSPLLPICHTVQQAHIEVVLNEKGEFQRASVLSRENTVVPATEDSAGRTSKPVPHPLCDKIQYCGADYRKFGGAKPSGFEAYVELLRRWQSRFPTQKARAILQYVERKTLVSDLISERVLHCGTDGRLLTEWTAEDAQPSIFNVLTAKEKKRDQGDAFVRWRVQVPGDQVSGVWEDSAVRESWIEFAAKRSRVSGFCMLSGEIAHVTENHPKRLRHGADGAKLVSSNDSAGFTYRGRFETPLQACSIGSIASQKAHNALRWLIDRQGRKVGSQVFVSWAIDGSPLPDPLGNTAELFSGKEEVAPSALDPYDGDVGQHYALRLGKAIAGYQANLTGSIGVVVLGLDSATPGRMAITFYRELSGSEFLGRIMLWHQLYSWRQSYSKEQRFTGAPSPNDIAIAAYGSRVDDKLRRTTIERLLPCIIDGQPAPRDVVESVVRRAQRRVGLDQWEWEKCLGIACGLVKGSQKEDYKMALEDDRCTRDYLYGRLLAIAENIEDRALNVANEKRDTTAAKLMQRFAVHPYSTWQSIELALVPYKTRLRTNRPAILIERDKALDRVMCMFKGDDFRNDSKLSGEFLLGYHCQRAALWAQRDSKVEIEDQHESEVEGETV